MAWKIDYSDTAKRALKSLDRKDAKRILDYMDTRIAPSANPRRVGKPLTGPLGGRWRYRVGNYRIICDIQDDSVRVLILQIGHRGNVYRK